MLRILYGGGVATSAHQIEGSACGDGKGMNIWDMFAKETGHIFEGQTGDVACDHYNRYREDVDMMKEMGVKAWSRGWIILRSAM